MLFWVGVAMVVLVFGFALSWGLRGYDEREHRPGTQRMRPPSSDAASGSNWRRWG